MGDLRCPVCGAANPARAKFCLECGATLVEGGAPSRDVRKVVTVLFADIDGSTAFAEDRDPEVVRSILARYFAAMRAAVERHGGTVEKFIGDAVMAVFGVPVAHEDDALRAVRAGVEVAAAVEALDAELGSGIRVRIGINTGPVAAGVGTPDTLVTGDAVNVAARLEQSAAPGEILIGETTARLLRGVAELESVPDLTVKGKSSPVSAHRVLDVRSDRQASARHARTPMIGRARELSTLRVAADEVAATGTPHLVVVVGTAGVGKSRLVREFLEDFAVSATVLRGRCLSYGRGITFWPVADIVRQAIGIEESDTAEEARGRLAAAIVGLTETDYVRVALERLLGLSATSGSSVEELSWATRRLLEHLATRRPLAVLVEDVHWAEPALLDLLGHVVTVGKAPIIVVTPTRPEIGESQPTFLEGPRTTTMVLEPLGDEAAMELLERLLPGDASLARLRARIADAADGNPLFVEELVAMLIDDGNVERSAETWTVTGPLDRIAMPPTIGALLTARLDRLGRERDVADRGSVVGRTFERREVAHLSPELSDADLQEMLAILIGSDLVRREPTDSSIEPAYRFRHILIRDAAYEALSKAERARLHERFADWLETVAGDRLGEIEEIVGYHQEQAVRYQGELGAVDGAGGLASRAAAHLAAVATRAADRGDVAAAANLFGRAADLMPAGAPGRDRLLIDLAVVLNRAGAGARADEALGAVIERATIAGDEVTRAHAVVARWDLGDIRADDQEAIRRDARAAIEILEGARDELGLTRAWHLLVTAHWYAGEGAEAEASTLRAMDHARLSGRRSELIQSYEDLTSILNTGPAAVDPAIERCRAIMASEGDDRVVEAWLNHALAHLLAKRGEFDEARMRAAATRRVLEENGEALDHAILSELVADVEFQAGEYDEAMRLLSEGREASHRLGRESAIVSAHLSHVAWHAGRYDVIRACADEGISAGGWTRALTQGSVARLLARDGRVAEAEALVRRALVHWETTDYLTYHGWTLEALADVMAMTGRPDDAYAALREAAELHNLKGSSVGVAKVEARLAALHSNA